MSIKWLSIKTLDHSRNFAIRCKCEYYSLKMFEICQNALFISISQRNAPSANDCKILKIFQTTPFEVVMLFGTRSESDSPCAILSSKEVLNTCVFTALCE